MGRLSPSGLCRSGHVPLSHTPLEKLPRRQLKSSPTGSLLKASASSSCGESHKCQKGILKTLKLLLTSSLKVLFPTGACSPGLSYPCSSHLIPSSHRKCLHRLGTSIYLRHQRQRLTHQWILREWGQLWLPRRLESQKHNVPLMGRHILT